MLLAYGVKKRSAPGTLLAFLGGDLIYRGTTGYSPLYDALGLPPAEELLGKSASIPYRQGIRIDKSITIDKPREELYSFLRKLDNLPRFMKNLRCVTQLSDRLSHWTAEGPGGRIVEWDAEIINDEPNELIGWRSLTGVDSAGSVHFKPEPDGRGTEVSIELQYNPPGGAIGAALARLTGNDPGSQVEENLRRLKQILETGEIATTADQPTGKQAAVRRQPARARRLRPASDPVQVASEDSFPASDAPSWTASPATLGS
jgi:uncharacterized membrane protein